MDSSLEKYYPENFREEDTKLLGDFIRNRQSAVLLGMRRVGISNFLRFFLNHPKIVSKYIDQQKHLFIPVDLNDLVERELYPFWVLTLKRILDYSEKANLNPKTIKYIESLFLDSIQSKNLFLIIDATKRSLNKIIEEGFLPTIFFIRFDRIKDVLNLDFFSNIQGLRDATNQKLSFVITSLRKLEELSPKIFDKQTLSVFLKYIYLKPAQRKDIETIYKTYSKNYKLKLNPQEKNELYKNVDGYIQYLQLSLICLNEEKVSQKNIFDYLITDERITLQSEELWESLSITEQGNLIKIIRDEPVTQEERVASSYLWDTGMLSSNDQPFSPLFKSYVQSKLQTSNSQNLEFSKKEHLLFNFLDKNLNEICERESIIEAVWPEEEALGVSDWAIDRLVARVRAKLKKQKTNLEIVTVKTRGYKLISK